ncbi:hypothetical protein BH23VER1_BH23VER1_26650 [soil metagenome]
MNAPAVASLALALALCVPDLVPAAAIPGLFNTGVDENGDLLPPSGTVDPHYTLTTSPDPTFTGPDAVTLAPGFPVGPWIAEGPVSRWISPNQTGAEAEPGSYTYTTTFDLTGFNHLTAQIEGEWATDDGGTDIILNGVNSFQSSGGFGGFTPFFLDFGFVEGVNTLEFVVNNGGATPNPTGLRVQMIGSVSVPDEPPSIRVQPVGSSTLLEGEFYTLTVSADGDEPLTYQWRKDGDDLMDENDTSLALGPLTADDTGDYDVVVTNDFGSATSNVATIAVSLPIPGIFNTGVDDEGVPLFDYEFDPHYQIVVNPDTESQDAIVQDSTLFPIVDGPWVANSDTSKWIGPAGDTIAAAGGTYRYRLTFDLTGFDPASAVLRGRWTSDNAGVDILLNGTSTGISHTGNFDTLFDFVIPAGAAFVSGTNTLDFQVNNASVGYTGLRVEDFVGGALPLEAPLGAPEILRHPEIGLVAATGSSATFTVLADGDAPLAYQWAFEGMDIDGAEASQLTLNDLTPENSGEYTVTVTNDAGTATSEPGTLIVITPIPGSFNTGVDSARAPLPDFSIDPHYQILVNPESESPDAIVLDSFTAPIGGAWLDNSATSKWIGPTSDSSAAEGIYTYRLTFNLDGFDASTAQIVGRWATDNGGLDILLNGISTGFASAGFTGYSDFAISSGIIAGTNTLDFLVENAPPTPNPTGLRVDSLLIGALPVSVPPLEIIFTGGDEAVLRWPDAFTGWELASSPTLTEWQPVATPVVGDGGFHTVTVPVGPDDMFFRLQR